MPDARQPVRAGELRKTTVKVVRGAIRLSDRIIFGLIAVAVLSPANKDQHVPNGYYLTFGAEEKLIINERGVELQISLPLRPANPCQA
ncbi:MAG: hypothetical protein DME38_01925 [Verrucomicrobia bacterium]|nr:MAG: hypothetical protein DME38_01925 [Verrucomicrobiota bacterium]